MFGTVSKISEAENVYFMELSQPSIIDVLIFKDDQNLNLKQGDYVEILGEIDEYNGKVEVIGHRIRIME
ncbi:MAG: OB-fold nucleic acid binding domain-containing protein [Nanoarchaeota archaeon]